MLQKTQIFFHPFVSIGWLDPGVFLRGPIHISKRFSALFQVINKDRFHAILKQPGSQAWEPPVGHPKW